MSRPRKFDECLVVGNAIKAFIADGPSTVSLEQLEAATSIGRKSLYNTFGGKQGLLEKAVKNFYDNSITNLVEPMEVDGASRSEIEEAVRRLVKQMTDCESGRGCLLFLTTQDSMQKSQQASDLAREYFLRLHNAFNQCIKNGKEKGEITSTMSVADLTDFFFGVFVGISNMARAMATDKAIQGFADVSLRTLD